MKLFFKDHWFTNYFPTCWLEWFEFLVVFSLRMEKFGQKPIDRYRVKANFLIRTELMFPTIHIHIPFHVISFHLQLISYTLYFFDGADEN